MALNKITIKGRYVGRDRKGIIVGGTPCYPGFKASTLSVDENTYMFLREGEKSGWFVIESDNYKAYCISRGRAVKAEEPKTEEVKVEEPKVEESKVEEVKVEEPKVEEVKTEEPKAEEVKTEEPKAKAKAKAKAKPKTKTASAE